MALVLFSEQKKKKRGGGWPTGFKKEKWLRVPPWLGGFSLVLVSKARGRGKLWFSFVQGEGRVSMTGFWFLFGRGLS